MLCSHHPEAIRVDVEFRLAIRTNWLRPFQHGAVVRNARPAENSLVTQFGPYAPFVHIVRKIDVRLLTCGPRHAQAIAGAGLHGLDAMQDAVRHE